MNPTPNAISPAVADLGLQYSSVWIVQGNSFIASIADATTSCFPNSSIYRILPLWAPQELGRLLSGSGSDYCCDLLHYYYFLPARKGYRPHSR